MTAPAVAAGQAVIAALHQAGVQHLALAPGSRSAPLALAAAAAERSGALQLHVRLDERSAGFVALGAAKVTGKPAAVLCTSGTATANLLPAVVEARYSGVPLVVLTADRPPELRGRGASQTIDQVGMFDQFVHSSTDLPVPTDEAVAVRWSAAVTAAAARAVRMRGPVHLNLPFRLPLVAASTDLAVPVAEHHDYPRASPGAPTEPLGLGARGVIIAGDLDVWDGPTRTAVADLADGMGWPIIWEASSNLAGAPTAISHGSLLLGCEPFVAGHAAEVVVTIGPFGLDRPVLEYVRTAGRHIAVQPRPRTDPPDPLGTASLVLERVPGLPAGAEPDGEWLAEWRRAAHLVGEVLTNVRVDTPTVAEVAQTVWAGATRSDLLVVAPSLMIRRLAARATGAGPEVIANRGANGIDGFVSTAVGAAAASGRRTVALLGDLTLLHDQNGFLIPATESAPDLTFVVADNNGGGIFATLEQGAPAFGTDYDRVFGTPHDRDLVELLTAAGVSAQRCNTAGELADALSTRAPGISALVVPTASPAAERTYAEQLTRELNDTFRAQGA